MTFTDIKSGFKNTLFHSFVHFIDSIDFHLVSNKLRSLIFSSSFSGVSWTCSLNAAFFLALMLHSPFPCFITERLHNSFHFNLSIHLFLLRGLSSVELERRTREKKSWSKFNSSEASNRNSLSKVMMQWWKTTCFTLVAACAARYTFAEAGFWLSRCIITYLALNILHSFSALSFADYTFNQPSAVNSFSDPSFGRGIINQKLLAAQSEFIISCILNTNFCFH